MKKIIINAIVLLLIVAAVIGGIVWLLPVKVSLAVLYVLQLATLIILGDFIQKHNGHDKEA
ncbi:MAG: hypothetical protein IJ551_09735 [Prevotella sp.]|nr:hypothetical protein [Prevotella sp.]